MTTQQKDDVFNVHIATNDARDILASGHDFLEVFAKCAALEDAFLVTAYWFHREIPVWIAALDQLYADYEFHYGQRVDLAIEYLRAQGVQCPKFTNYLMRQSRYGNAPAGSVNASLDRIAMEHYKRLASEAQEEIARLQSGIAAIRERWQARRDAMQVEFREETRKGNPSDYPRY